MQKTEPDLVIVSDLHIGRGLNPSTRRYHNLETFFYDDDFAEFCQWLADDADHRKTKLRMVLNGDVFDFLRIDRPQKGGSSGERVTLRERRFGAALTPQTAPAIIKSLLAGHPLFVGAIANLLTRGHEIIFLPGNHDLEVHWSGVQDCIREAVLGEVEEQAGKQSDEAARLAAAPRLIFKPWFHYEEGRIWIEHGCQYDPENAFRYPLRGQLADDASYEHDEEIDLPLGNFFQRYLYNAFGSITFIVPTSRANMRYFKWLLFNQPRLLLRVASSHLPFAFQLLRRMARSGGRQKARDLEKAHLAALAELAKSSGLGAKLYSIDHLKSDRAQATQAAETIVREGLRLVSIGFVALLTMGVLWFALFHAINGLQLGFGLKALLSVGINVLLALGALFGLTTYLLRATDAQEPLKPLRLAAGEIAKTVQVPIVTFGHTHDEVVWCLPQGSEAPSWYFNTGTWVAVFTHDVLMPRERVQFTYLHVEGLDAKLKQWSPGRGHPMPVVLIDERTHVSSPPSPAFDSG